MMTFENCSIDLKRFYLASRTISSRIVMLGMALKSHEMALAEPHPIAMLVLGEGTSSKSSP